MDEYIKSVLDSKDHVGVKVRKIREYRNLSIDKVSDMIGISYGSLYNFEVNGFLKRAKIDFEKLNEVLNVQLPVQYENNSDKVTKAPEIHDTVSEERVFNVKIINSKLKKLIADKGLTYKDIANVAHIPLGSLNYWIGDHSNSWPKTSLDKVLSALDVDSSNFLSVNNDSTDKNGQSYDKKFVGKQLKKALSDNNMSYEEFSRLMNWRNPNFIGRVINGEVKLSKTTRTRILEIIGQGPDFFTTDNIDSTNDCVTVKVDDGIYNRILYAASYRGITFRELNAVLSDSRCSIEVLLRNNLSINTKDINTIADTLNVPLNWLLTGECENEDRVIFPNPEYIRELVLNLRDKFNMEKSEFKKFTGIDSDTVSKRNTRSIMHGEDIVNKISKIGGLDKNDIISEKFTVNELCHKIIEHLNTPGFINRVVDRMTFMRLSPADLTIKLEIGRKRVIKALSGTTLDQLLIQHVSELSEILDCSKEFLLTGTPDPYVNFTTYDHIVRYFAVIRRRLGWSKSEASRRLGRNKSYIPQMENLNSKEGQRQLRPHSIVTLCKLYQVEPSEITKRCSDELKHMVSTNARRPDFDVNKVELYDTDALINKTRERIKEAREIRGMSIGELSLALGYKSRDGYGRFENGKSIRSNFSLEKCAEILDVPVGWLMGGDETPFPTDEDKMLPEPEMTVTESENMEADKMGKPVILDESPLMTAIITELANFDDSTLIKIYERIIELKKLKEYEKLKRGE